MQTWILVYVIFVGGSGIAFWTWITYRKPKHKIEDCAHLRIAETEDAEMKCLDCGKNFTYEQYNKSLPL